MSHRVADRLAHAFDLMLAALVQRELEAAEARSPRDDPSARRRRQPVLELDPVAEAGEIVRRRRPFDVGFVDLRDAVAWVREPVREIAVVREEEGAGRVDVEPPDRDDPRLSGNEVDDRSPSVRVACRGDDAIGLVQQQVGERLRRDARTVDLDDVALPHVGVQLSWLAVHAHPAFADELVGAPARRDAGAREVCVEAHGRILARVLPR